MTKRIGMILLAVVMVVTLLAACSGNNNNGGSQSPSNTTNGDGGSGQDAALDEVTFTFFNAGASRTDVETKNTQVGEIHFENTGVNLRMEHLVGDVATRIGTMIAGGQYPDIVVPDTEIDKIVEAGAFIDLKPLIEEHAPNIQKIYGPFMNLMTHADGSIYFLPFGPQVGEYVAEPTIGQGAYWIQHRVLKEFDYPVVKTLDEYFDLIESYIEKYPNENLTGFTALTDDWRFFALTNQPNHLAGYPNDGAVIIDLDTLEATDYGYSDYAKRWLRKLNDINAKGMFDQASFINNYDQYLAKLVSGEVLGYFDYGWQVNQANQTLDQEGTDKQYFPLPIVLDSNIKDQYLDPPAFVNNRGIGITTSADDPERIIKFFDYLLSEENQILNQWGIEGLTYEIDGDGRFYRTIEQIEALRDNEYRQNVGLTYFEYYLPMWSQASTLSDGNALSPGRQGEVALLSFTDSAKEIMAAYGVSTFAEMFALPDDRPWYPAWSIGLEPGSTEEIYETRREDLQREFYPQLILANPNEFDALWDQYVSQFMNLEVDTYEETFTRLVREKNDSVLGN